MWTFEKEVDMDADMELVLDTLYDRKRSERKGCFVVNRAGLSLIQSDLSIVPAIEYVLKEIVDPALSGSQVETYRLPGLDPLWADVMRYNPASSKFPGLDFVLGAYIVLGVKLDPERVVTFLSNLSTPLPSEAVKNIPAFFAPPGEGYNPGISLGDRLKEFVQSLSKSESEDVRKAAARVMEWTLEKERLS